MGNTQNVALCACTGYRHHEFKGLTLKEKILFIEMIPLFRKVEQPDLPRIAAKLHFEQYRAGDLIVNQGDKGQELFLIHMGKVQVLVRTQTDSGINADTHVGNLADGDYFGEMSLLHAKPRNATIKAFSAVSVLRLDKNAFDELELRYKLHFPKRGAVREGRAASGTIPDELRIKTPEQLQRLKTALRNNCKIGPLLASAEGDEVIDEISNQAYRQEFSPGTFVLKQGDLKADLFYIVEDGHLDVFKNFKKVQSLNPGDSFGELALIYRAPRAADVKAISKVTLWVVQRESLRKVEQLETRKKIEAYAKLLASIDIFKEQKEKDLQDLADALVETTFREGEYIIKQGEEGVTFFLLHQGELKIEVDGKEVSTLIGDPSKGLCDYFGERSLLKGEPRAASVRVSSETATVLALDQGVFRRILDIDHHHEPNSPLSPGGRFDVKQSQKEIVEHRLEDFQTIGLLGCGGFGAVTLVKKKETSGVYFALKAVSKGYLCKMRQQEAILNEKEVMSKTRSPFLVRLAATFNHTEYLYFLLEPVYGGELWTLYSREDLHGSEDHARFYVACVCEGLRHLHVRYIVYRDLKTENIMLDERGYCKIADFGLAKFVLGHTYTTCGTPEYFAPEMITGAGHTHAVDWWALGILAYELMMGSTPFVADDVHAIFRKIQHGIDTVGELPRQLPWGDLVRQLCRKFASERLPVRVGGVRNIETHEWLSSFDWDALKTRVMVAPYQPEIANKEDLRNFDASAGDQPPQIPYEDIGTEWDKPFENRFGPECFTCEVGRQASKE